MQNSSLNHVQQNTSFYLLGVDSDVEDKEEAWWKSNNLLDHDSTIVYCFA